MSQQELLTAVVRALDACGILYMVTGSVASGLYGEPRATHDVDLVTELSREKVDQLMSCFVSPAFFLQKDAVLEAVAKSTMFNLLSIEAGDKVDFWMLTDDPFDQSRFARRVAKNIAGTSVFVSTPEDTILAKLRWCQLAGGSEKQRTDVLRVYEVQYGRLDEAYIGNWVEKLGVNDLWEEIRSEAGKIDAGDD